MYYDFLNMNKNSRFLPLLGFSQIDLSVAVISPKNSNELKKAVESNQKAGFLVLKTNNESTISIAVKNCSVDAVIGPLHYTYARIMGEKNIASLITFSDLFKSEDKARTLRAMKKVVRLAIKNNVPIMLSSGAENEYEQKGASDILAFGELINLTPKQAKEALFKHQEAILERNKLKNQGKWVAKGLNVV